ncbi:MAG: hypothetical protein AAB664_01345, partial [Patescibacteria group bacterium]
AIVLDTVWGNALDTIPKAFMNLSEFPKGKDLEEIAGRKRRIELSTIGEKKILVLRGSVCMNECTFNPYAVVFVRMQIELLLRLGVKNLILTSDTNGTDVHCGYIVFIDSFVSDFNETMPLFPGEYSDPEKVLDSAWIDKIDESSYRPTDCLLGAYAFWRGPHREGATHDHKNMFDRNILTVGMNIKPECSIASRYPDVRVLALAYVESSMIDTPEQTDNNERNKKDTIRLRQFLTDVIANI